MVFSCFVFQGCWFCVSSNADNLLHVFWLGIIQVLSSPLAWVIFLLFLPLCNQPACACLALQRCCGAATLSITRLTSLFLLRGKGSRGVGFWGLGRWHRFTAHQHQKGLVCFLSFFHPCRFWEIEGIFKPPALLLKALKHTCKCIHFHHAFAVQYPRTLVLSDSGSA